MKYTFSVDPGVRYAAVAAWCDRRLIATRRIVTPRFIQRGYLGLATAVFAAELDVTPDLVIETPRSYTGKSVKEKDLRGLRQTVDEVVEAMRLLGGEVHRVYPSDWKGTVPKAVHQPRIIGALTPHELALLGTVNRPNHDIVDAVGLGLWHLGRTGRGGVTGGVLARSPR